MTPMRAPLRAPRRALPRPAAALLVGLLLASGLAACGGEDSVKPGDTVPARDTSQFDDGTQSTLTLPIGRLEVYLGKPVESLPSKDTLEPGTLRAGSEEIFVPITWQYDTTTTSRFTDYLGDDPATPRVDLVADGASYRLSPPDTRADGVESFYLLVSGKAEELSLKVDYDGVAQTVDLRSGERDTGAAQPLYDLKPARRATRSCAADTSFKPAGAGKVPTYDCTVSSPVRLPYAAGEWAPAGTTFVGVTVTTTLTRYDEVAPDLSSSGVYYGTGVTPSFQLGAQRAVQVLRDPNQTVCPDAATAACTTTFHVIFPDPGSGAAARRLRGTEVFSLELASSVSKGRGDDDPTTLTARIDTRLR